MKNSFAPLIAALLMFSPVGLSAQNQPGEATNQQDEVVTIHLAPGEGSDRVLQILRSGDKFETNRYVSRVFELHNTTAYEIRNLIRTAIEQEKGSLRGAATRPTDGSQSRQFLLVTTTAEQMPTVEEAIRTLDVNGLVNSQGSSRAAIRVRYRRASDLAQIIRQTRATSQTKLFADDLTNTLYYDDSESVVRAIEPFVQFFDVPIPQVEFDVQIIEVREDNIGKIGLDWDAWKRTIGGQIGLTSNQFEGGDSFTRLDTLLTLDATVLANFLNYTVQNGNARLVQRSRLNASNLEPAVISDVKRVAFHDYARTEREPRVVTEANPRVDSYRTYDRDNPSTVDRVVTIVPPVTNRLVDLSSDQEGLLIAIQPVIGMETVTARIDIAMNTVVGMDKLDRPIVTEQNLENLVTLKNGQEILLGTLERQTTLDSRRGIPVLKDIPVAGALFAVESTRSERSRLFIVATPKFSTTAFEARSMAEMANNIPVLRFDDHGGLNLEDGVLEAAAERARVLGGE